MLIPTRIEVDGGDAVLLAWEDGSSTRLSARQLRAACQCANCREPNGAKATQRALAGDVSITNASIVGNYAVNFVFAPDGHGTGIFPFTVLYALGEDPSTAPSD